MTINQWLRYTKVKDGLSSCFERGTVYMFHCRQLQWCFTFLTASKLTINSINKKDFSDCNCTNLQSLAFRASRINQRKTLAFAQADARISQGNLRVNLRTQSCARERRWWINHSAELSGSEAQSQSIKRPRQRDTLGSHLWPLSSSLWSWRCLHSAPLGKKTKRACLDCGLPVALLPSLQFVMPALRARPFVLAQLPSLGQQESH